ncbi:hypothetical protein V8J88_03545 [Massilia sp. W12]|uniref:hypothetical protein n=1 Tax=Massilia sp. W12 TaxID=3126507 RepID=UPI0030CF6A46
MRASKTGHIKMRDNTVHPSLTKPQQEPAEKEKKKLSVTIRNSKVKIKSEAMRALLEKLNKQEPDWAEKMAAELSKT